MDFGLEFHLAQRYLLSETSGGPEIVSRDPEERGANLDSPVV